MPADRITVAVAAEGRENQAAYPFRTERAIGDTWQVIDNHTGIVASTHHGHRAAAKACHDRNMAHANAVKARAREILADAEPGSAGGIYRVEQIREAADRARAELTAERVA